MKRVLFVDDDPTLLSSMSRLFESRYEVVTANTARKAEELLDRGAKFEVIVTDQRMPEQTGLEMVDRLRKQGHGSRFIMLTGTGDVDVATQAINLGGVFRLLHKPATADELNAAIADGFGDYAKEAARDALLQKTFVGAVSAITTMIDEALPEFVGLSARVSKTTEALCKHLETPARWEYLVAARLALAGFVATPSTPDATHWRGHDAVAEQLNDFAAGNAKAADLIGAIPRLDVPSQILHAFPESNGSLCSLRPKSPGAIVSVGANLVRTSLLAEMLLHHGVGPDDACRELAELLPEAHEAIPQIVASHAKPAEDLKTKRVAVEDLEPGMVTAETISGLDGGVLVRARKRLTISHVDNLLEARSNRRIESYVLVKANSYAAFRDASPHASFR
ncbi:MAG: response regulator [Planctomycetota bacterium]